MTHISFTSGEIMDIIDALSVKGSAAEDAGEHQLSAYYLHMVQQFEEITYKLQELPGEQRVANLVMTL